MVEDILEAANIPAKEGRFPDPPESVYAVFFHSKTSDGPDHSNRIFYHDCTVEIYAPVIDPGAVARLEKVLDAHGIQYTTQGWYWLDSIRRYQEIYEFSYITKN